MEPTPSFNGNFKDIMSNVRNRISCLACLSANVTRTRIQAFKVKPENTVSMILGGNNSASADIYMVPVVEPRTGRCILRWFRRFTKSPEVQKWAIKTPEAMKQQELDGKTDDAYVPAPTVTIRPIGTPYSVDSRSYYTESEYDSEEDDDSYIEYLTNSSPSSSPGHESRLDSVFFDATPASPTSDIVLRDIDWNTDDEVEEEKNEEKLSRSEKSKPKGIWGRLKSLFRCAF